MTDREQTRWDVNLPGGGDSKAKDRGKTVVSGLVLLALLAGPILFTNRSGSENEPAPDRSQVTVAEVSAFASDEAEAQDGRRTSSDNADSAGTQYERYFPGRKAM